jgi:uncharacterized protein YndB with AHSA1/START domain
MKARLAFAGVNGIMMGDLEPPRFAHIVADLDEIEAELYAIRVDDHQSRAAARAPYTIGAPMSTSPMHQSTLAQQPPRTSESTSVLSTTIDIAAPTERVWQVMSDPERWHEWTPSITRITLFGGGPLTVGARAMTRQPKLPPAMWKVTALEPGRSFTWVSVAPGLRVVANHAVEPTADGSRAMLSIEFNGLFRRMWGRMSKAITERYLALEATGLKARSENPEFRIAAARR